MKLRRTLDPGFAPLLLLPVADLLAILLAFFLLSGGFLLQPGISVQVPDSPFLLAPQREPRVVSVTGEPLPAIYFDNRRMDARELDARLALPDGRSRTLIIKADRRAPLELIVAVSNAAIARGYSVVLATREEP